MCSSWSIGKWRFLAEKIRLLPSPRRIMASRLQSTTQALTCLEKTVCQAKMQKCCCEIFSNVGDTANVVDKHLAVKIHSKPDCTKTLPLELLPYALRDFFPSKMPGYDLWYGEIKAEEAMLLSKISSRPPHFHSRTC